jgi:hypothetical protein
MNEINSFDANDLRNIKLDENYIVRDTQDVTSAFVSNNEEKQDTSQQLLTTVRDKPTYTAVALEQITLQTQFTVMNGFSLYFVKF